MKNPSHIEMSASWQTQGIAGRLMVIVGSSSFLALVLPCFFKLSNGQSQLLDSPAFGTFVPATLIGGFLCALVMVIFGVVGHTIDRLKPKHVLIGAVLFCLGYCLMLVSSLIGEILWLAIVAGALFGAGAVIMTVVWCLMVARATFRSLLMGCAVGILCAMVLVAIIVNLPISMAATLSVVLLGAGVFLPCWHCHQTKGLRFAHCSLSALGIEDEVFLTNPSIKDLFIVFSVPIIGLVLNAVNSNSQQLPFDYLGTTISAFGLATAAGAILLLFFIPWKREMFPFILWVALPAVAGAQVFLSSFPLETLPHTISTMINFPLLALLTLLAITLLLLVVNQGEFSPLLSIGFAVALAAAGSLAGFAFLHSGMESLARGQLMFALSAAFCVYLLITPALQLWRTRRSTYEDLDPCAMTKVEDIQDRCDALATRHGLSRREHEILRYLSQGYNAPYIASALVISESTVRSHTKNIYHKLGVSSRMELLEMAQKGSISNA